MDLLAATTSNTAWGAMPAPQRLSGRQYLKHDPLAAETVQRLVSWLLPPDAEVSISTAKPDWFLRRQYRRLHRNQLAGQDIRNLVAAKYFELDAVTGSDGDRLSKVGVSWNCRHRVYGFDIDWAWLPDVGTRGCNHPDNDDGNAIARLQQLVHDLTGGTLAITRSLETGGIWLIGVAPADVNAELLAQDLLRQMLSEGYSVGKGCLELPLNNARLPLAGYVLDGHEHLPWIEQAGELLGFIEEQAATVKLTRPVHYSTRQLSLELSLIEAGPVADHAGITLKNLRWRPEVKSNGFLGACAIRMARAGHGAESVGLMASLVESHPDWQRHASEDSKRKLWHWCLRWLKWAERNVKADSAKPAGPSNKDKHQSWNDRVRAGVRAAVANGLERITHVIEHLVTHQGMSRRLLWERRDLIEDGIEREQTAAAGRLEQECLAFTPTQLIPMGVKEPLRAELPVQGPLATAVPCLESFESAVPVPPVTSAEPATCGATVETEGEPLLQKPERESGFDLAAVLALARARLGIGGGPPVVTAPSRIEAGEDLLSRRRQHEREELMRWLAG